MCTALDLNQGSSRRTRAGDTFSPKVATVTDGCSGVYSASDAQGLEAQDFAQLPAPDKRRKAHS